MLARARPGAVSHVRAPRKLPRDAKAGQRGEAAARVVQSDELKVFRGVWGEVRRGER